MIKNITIGADPELFVEKNNEIVSAEGMIGGTKQHPKKISEKGHAIQEDNIMVEFNIPESATEDIFVDNINFVLDHLDTLLLLKGDYKLNYSASAEINKKYLKTKQAKLFGCDPDLNIYLKDVNESPSATTNLRTCGGHIHIGYANPNQEDSENLIYAMDIALGLPSILLDTDDRRREMYGNAGCFRFKDYGVEYRSLSNFWLKSDDLKRWVYTETQTAIYLVNSGVIPKIVEKFGNQIRQAINNNNKILAKELIFNVEKEIKNIKEKVNE